MSGDGHLVPVPWESRNLGIPAFELSGAFVRRPDADALEALLAGAAAQCGSFFVQARVPIATPLAQVLERNGFYFAEATVAPVTILERNDAVRRFGTDRGAFVPARFRPAELAVSRLERADASQCAAVKAIAAESFSEDRFHGDHNCEPAVADRRFVHWVGDLLGDPGVAFDVLSLRGRPVAFMARKAEHLILAGFARQYVGAGLGDFLWLAALEHMRGGGLRRAHTLVSIRNVASLNLHARLGFKFREPMATFHYWKRPETTR